LKKIDAGAGRPSGKSAYPGTSPTFVHPQAVYSRSASLRAMVSKVSRVLPRLSSKAANKLRPRPRRRALLCTSPASPTDAQQDEPFLHEIYPSTFTGTLP